MSYAAKGDRVFLYQDPAHPNCTPPGPRRSDHRLKRFRSTIDKRAWHFCEEVRGRHFHDFMSGSQTCLNMDECHKYVPLEDLIRILMAEKDELIKQLQEQLRQCCEGESANRESQRQEIAALTQEVNKSRDMLRKAMHKLENIDEIVNENKQLQCRLRCSEERVRYLEEKKKTLECELAELRSKSQIQIDLERAQKMLSVVTAGQSTEMDEAVLQCLAMERDQLQEKVKNLEKELEESKKKEAEIEMLKKQSQSDSIDREEMSRENECYRKKLASMKCLEKQIQELKKQGRALADKYRREAQKAAEQMNRMCQASKELQCLREERDSLKKRVNELSSYECQYNKLQRKLQRVDAVIAENEALNCKLLALQDLEKENEFLKCRLEGIQEMEMNAAEDKERIMQLQCAVADQEEEMKDLLCQIERLTSGTHEEELERLKCELYEKNSKLKLCEEQLAEIPMLEAEIDELRAKLQCCCKEFPEKKRGENSYQKVEVRFPATSTGLKVNYKTPGEKCSSVIGIRREEKVDLKDKHGSCQEIQAESRTAYKVTCSQKKDVMSCEEVHSLLQSSKGIISCVLEDMIEHQKEMEELEQCNRAMKEEIEALKAKVGGSDTDCLLEEINQLRKAIQEKDAEISRLQRAGSSRGGEDVETLKELNRQMKEELAAACEGLKQVANLEKMLEKEHKARCEAETRLGGQGKPPRSEGKSAKSEGQISKGEGPSTRSEGQISKGEGPSTRSEGQISKGEGPSTRSEGQMTRSQAQFSSTQAQTLRSDSRPAPGKVTEEDPDFDCCRSLQKETEDLKLQIEALNKLTEELKRENELLRELQQPCPDFSKELDEKCALENLLALLQAELDAFKGQKLSDECTALRNELKRVLEQNCQLKALLDCYRQRLDLEKKSNELNQAKLGGEAGGKRGAPGREGELEEEGAEGGRGRRGKGGLEGEEGEEGEEGGPGGRRTGGRGTGETEGGKSGPSATPSELARRREEEEGGTGGTRTGGRGTGETEGGTGGTRTGGRGTGETEGGTGGTRTGGRGTGETEGGKSGPSATPSELARRREEEEGGTGGTRTGGRGTGETEGGTGGTRTGGRGTGETEGGTGGRGTGETEGGTGGTRTGGRGTGETEGGTGARRTEETGEGTEGTKTVGRGTGETEGGKSGPSATPESARRREEEEGRAGGAGGAGGPAPTSAELERERQEAAKRGPASSPSEIARLGKGADKSDVQGADKNCEEELKALRQENANLKNSLADAEKRLNLAGSDAEKELLKELEKLKKEKEGLSQQLEAAAKGGEAGSPENLLKELEQLKKDKENLLKQAQEGPGGPAAAAAEKAKDDCMKELEKLRKEKEDLEKQLADARAGKPGAGGPGGPGAAEGGPAAAAAAAAAEKAKDDCMKELEKLRKEKEDLEKQLADARAGKPGAGGPGGAEGGPAAAAAAAAAEKAKDDCMKELEKLRKEKEDLEKQLADARAGKPGADAAGTGAVADCLKELEELKKQRQNELKELEQLKAEKKDLEKRVTEAEKGGAGGPLTDKERADLLKELEQLKKEKKEMAEQLGPGKGAAGAFAGAPDDLQERLRQLEAENAEKLRKLMEQHEKEMADRDKAYNDNLNSMKAGYETDIRKLAERHKASIMRLQELHDDEVQEMNVNYETQLETMQTQSEAAINDVAQGSAAKQRKMAEQHSKDIKEAEAKFHVALDEKESEYLEQLGGLRSALTKSKQELEALKKQGKPGAAGDIEKLKAQQARELQKARRTSKQKVDAMKAKMEDEKRKSEAEIEALKQQLKEQGKGDEVCTCKFSKKKPPKVRDPTCPLDFNEVLEKILEEGLDSLTFNEIALVHRKTCCALEGIVMKSDMGPLLELEPPVGDGCPHTPLLEADKQQLLSRIFNLENAIQQKQRQTQEAITSMEVAIKRERCRLQEVKNSLQNEQQKNLELKQLLTSQTKLQTDLRKERDRLGNQASLHESLCQQKSKQLDEEMRSKKCLEAELDQVKRTLKQLCMAHDSERRNFSSKQGDQMELMRQKLEQSVQQERRLALQLENETKCRLQLQCQLQTLRQSLKHMVNLPAVESVSICSQSPFEAKSAKERQNLDQINEKKNKIKSKSPKKQKK